MTIDTLATCEICEESKGEADFSLNSGSFADVETVACDDCVTLCATMPALDLDAIRERALDEADAPTPNPLPDGHRRASDDEAGWWYRLGEGLQAWITDAPAPTANPLPVSPIDTYGQPIDPYAPIGECGQCGAAAWTTGVAGLLCPSHENVLEEYLAERDADCPDCGAAWDRTQCLVCGWVSRPVVMARPAEPAEPILVPTAFARYAGIASPASGARRIIVDSCPYCGQSHRHTEALGETSNQRLADCFRGEYILSFEKPLILARPAEISTPIFVSDDEIVPPRDPQTPGESPGGGGGDYTEGVFVQPVLTPAELYAAAIATDKAWQSELERQFGKDAGTVRYTVEGRAGPVLAPLNAEFQRASAAWRTCMLQAQEADFVKWSAERGFCDRPVAPQNATDEDRTPCPSDTPDAAPTSDRPAVAPTCEHCGGPFVLVREYGEIVPVCEAVYTAEYRDNERRTTAWELVYCARCPAPATTQILDIPLCEQHANDATARLTATWLAEQAKCPSCGGTLDESESVCAACQEDLPSYACPLCETNAHRATQCPDVAQEWQRQERVAAAGRGIARQFRQDRTRFLKCVARVGDSDRLAMAGAYADYLGSRTDLFDTPPVNAEQVLRAWAVMTF